MKCPKNECTIGLIAKYLETNDASKSVYAAISHSDISNNCKVSMEIINTQELEQMEDIDEIGRAHV
jgi:CTP synthase